MKGLRTYKLKITSDHPRFAKLASDYKQAANWLSNIVFKQKTTDNPNHLSKKFYATVREKFNLPSQLTCSLFRHVVSTYRSMKSNGEWSLATYKKTAIPLCWERDFRIRKKGVSIWGEVITYKTQPLPEGKWSDSKLKLIKGQWYLCLTIKIDQAEQKTTGGIIGVDRGQKNIFVAVDPKTNKTLYVRGGELNHRRLCIRQTRGKVASVGTRSAHRLLKRLSGREKAVTQNILHIASKRLVAFAEEVGAKTIAFENLIGLKQKSTKDNKKQHHKQRARNNRWAYAMLEFFVTYKAAFVGIGIEHVSARNTSRGCPRCGHVDKSNRNGLEFRCVACGFADNADRVGGTNVSLRLLLQRQAVGERAVCQSAYSSSEVQGNSELQAPILYGRGN
jgi:IS605 OrfB family transposase